MSVSFIWRTFTLPFHLTIILAHHDTVAEKMATAPSHQCPSVLRALPRLRLPDRVPNARTIRLFREHLTQAVAIEVLFNRSGTMELPQVFEKCFIYEVCG